MKIVTLSCHLFNHFHFGKSGIEDTYNYIRSDTLFSAIVSTYNMMYPKRVADLISDFSEGKIRISSAFHLLENQANHKRVYFLPKPLVYDRATGENLKKIKRIKFISTGVWKEAPCVENLMDEDHGVYIYPSLNNTYILTREELERLAIYTEPEKEKGLLTSLRIVSNRIDPKVNVHSKNQEGVFYHKGSISLNQLEIRYTSGYKPATIMTHFYFLLDPSGINHDEEKIKMLEGCIKLLADEGIGGDRSTGSGIFKEANIKDDNSTFVFSDKTNLFCNLSLVIPESESAFEQVGKYKLILRGGGIIGRYGDEERHRGQVRMIEEGAMMKHPISGKIVDLSPAQREKLRNPVYRSGICLAIPFPYEQKI